ncbi:MAG: RsmD family RNA methyltransferase [Phycisphaeraceae bacterium]|nr:RsmD family RNA methyltransferase [Phycisphaeraceae bacterium]
MTSQDGEESVAWEGEIEDLAEYVPGQKKGKKGGKRLGKGDQKKNDSQLVTRPITDRVKVALFDRLMAMGVTGRGHVVDVFAGTGSLGLEALSRGAEHCTFVEKHRPSRELLEENLNLLSLTAQAKVLGMDALWSNWLVLLPHRPVDLAFCDPPYAMAADKKTWDALVKLMADLGQALVIGGILVLRTKDRVPGPAVPGLLGPDTHAYGSMVLHFYERVEGQAAAG